MATHLTCAVTGPDWASVPVVDVAMSRFVIPLHDLDPTVLWHRIGMRPDEPVHAFSRWADRGDAQVSDGRHRILRALLRGDATVPTRLLVIN